MNDSEGPAAPESGIPEIDLEIADLLKFEPAPRKVKRPNGWTPALQRRFIAKLAELGSPTKAAEALGRDRFGVEKLYRTEGADSFRAAWDRAIEIAEERIAAAKEAERSQWAGVRPPGGIDRRMSSAAPKGDGPLPGQVLNEYGEWEDGESFARRGEEAKDSIARKLLRIRRLYLQEISSSPGKRAAFEILTELPIDWEKAKACEPQADEPWRTSNQRKPDMILLAESGWSFGETGYGPDRKAEARRALDAARAEQGLPPVEWECESTERSDADA